MKKNIYHRKPNERMIHIKAESEIYSVNEIVRESAVVKRLTIIRDIFKKINQRHDRIYSLKVTTGVHNPTFF